MFSAKGASSIPAAIGKHAPQNHRTALYSSEKTAACFLLTLAYQVCVHSLGDEKLYRKTAITNESLETFVMEVPPEKGPDEKRQTCGSEASKFGVRAQARAPLKAPLTFIPLEQVFWSQREINKNIFGRPDGVSVKLCHI